MIKINKQLLMDVLSRSRFSPRKRINYNFHKEYSDPINRLLNAAQIGTYVRPHKHLNKIEIFIILFSF